MMTPIEVIGPSGNDSMILARTKKLPLDITAFSFAGELKTYFSSLHYLLCTLHKNHTFFAHVQGEEYIIPSC